MYYIHRVPETEEPTPFDKFRDLAQRIVAVLKQEADEIAEREKTVPPRRRVKIAPSSGFRCVGYLSQVYYCRRSQRLLGVVFAMSILPSVSQLHFVNFM
jgi:hypothetical protein